MGHYLIVSAYPPDFTESAQLKYPPLVGVYLTLDTVSAAFRLAGKKQDPTPVTWDTAGKQTETPVWINYDPNDYSSSVFPWSKATPDKPAYDRGFIFRYAGDSSISQRLITKLEEIRGLYWFGGSGQAATRIPPDLTRKHLELFLRAVASHIHERVSRVFSEAIASGKISVVIDASQVPGGGPLRDLFNRIFQHEFGNLNIECHMLERYTSSLRWSLSHTTQSDVFRRSRPLALFHVGRHYSVCSKYSADSTGEDSVLKLRPEGITRLFLCSFGSCDISSQLGNILRRKCVNALQDDDRVSGREIVEAIDSKLEDFLLSLPSLAVEKSKVFKFRFRNVVTTNRKFVTTSVTVTPDEWKDEVFGPILGEMEFFLRESITKKTLIHLSGTLFECAYVSQCFQNLFADSMLRTSDEALGGAFGATISVDPPPDAVKIIFVPGLRRQKLLCRDRLLEPFTSLDSITSSIEIGSESALQNLKYNEASLQEILQQGRFFASRESRTRLTTAIDAVITRLKQLDRVEEAREIATNYCRNYFDLRHLDPSGRGGLLPTSRRTLWAGRNSKLEAIDRPDRRFFENESFWMNGREDAPAKCLKILRYMMLLGDIDAVQIGRDACTLWQQEIDEPMDDENIISMALMTESVNGVRFLVDAGAKRSDCLYWAIHWQCDEIVRWILSSEQIREFTWRSWMGTSRYPLSLAIQQKHTGIVRALLEHNRETPGAEDMLSAFQHNIPSLTQTMLSFLQLDTNREDWATLRGCFSHALRMKKEQGGPVNTAQAVIDATRQDVLLYGTVWADIDHVRRALEAGANLDLVFSSMRPGRVMTITSEHRLVFEELASNGIDPLTMITSPESPPRPFIEHCVRLGCSVQLINGRFVAPDRYFGTTSSIASDLNKPEAPGRGFKPFSLEGPRQRPAEVLVASDDQRRQPLPSDGTVKSAAELHGHAEPTGAGNPEAAPSAAILPNSETATLVDQDPPEDEEFVNEGLLEIKGGAFPRNIIYSRHHVWLGSDALSPEEETVLKPLCLDRYGVISPELPRLAAWARVTGKGVLFARLGEGELRGLLLADASDPVPEASVRFSFIIWGIKISFKAPDAATRTKWISTLKRRIAEAKSAASAVMQSDMYKQILEEQSVRLAQAAEEARLRQNNNSL